MTYLVLGAGQAGYMTAKTLRENDPGAEIGIFDTETDGLYAKMRLPEYVGGTLPEEKLILVRASAFDALGIRTFFGVKVSRVVPAEHRIYTSDGRDFRYDKLVFATGAEAFVPNVKGLEHVSFHTLRTLADARSLTVLPARPDADALVIGGGLLGLEAAWALRQRGFDVTVSEFMNRLLPRQLGEGASALLLRKLNALNLKFRLNACLEAVEPAGVNRIKARFADGFETECSLLLFSSGIRSRVELACGAGLKVNRAIPVNSRLQTSDPDIYAAGDCAELDGKTPGLWLAARDQGIALGEILSGKRDSFVSPVYAPVLKIAGIKLQDLIREAAE